MSSNLDLLLVVPGNPSTVDIVAGAHGVTPPLGVAYIAAYIRREGFKVKILDNNIEKLTIDGFKKYLGQVNPRYIGFSLLSFAVNSAFSLACTAKEVNKDITVIAGGPHASALPRDVLRHQAIDIVVKGEGEETMRELVHTMDSDGSLDKVSGIVYNDNGNIVENSRREFIADLESLPLPAYELLPMKSYYLAPSRRFTRSRVGSIITSRGCPYRCTFCSRAVFGHTIRYRSPESVVGEIKYLVDNFGVGELEIRDDTFTVDEARAIEICERIQKSNANIIWNCCGRVNHTSDKLFQALYRAGCRALFFGAESGSQRILQLFKKDITLEQIELAVRQCKKFGILSLASFIIGSPYETEDTVLETINFAKRLNPDFVSFCAFTPLPGLRTFQ